MQPQTNNKQDSPNEEAANQKQIGEGQIQVKKRLLVKKKKKKKTHKQQTINPFNYSVNPREIGSIKIQKPPVVYTLDNKSYEQLIIQAKKPNRMPPPLPTKKKQKIALQQQDPDFDPNKNIESELIFFKPRTSLFNNHNRKKKTLFQQQMFQQKQYNSLLQSQPLEKQMVFNKLKEMKVTQQKNKIQLTQIKSRKPKTQQQLLLEFLRNKYAVEEEQQPELERQITFK